MELEAVVEEYVYYCLAKGFTRKTLINKKQEQRNLKQYLKEQRGISQLESIHLNDLRAYILFKQQLGLQPQSVVSMYKMVSAFFNWCVKEEYLKGDLMKKVETPKVPKKVLEGFNADDIYSMIEACSYKSYQEARDKAIIAMLADSGLRAMEIRSLDKVIKEAGARAEVKGKRISPHTFRHYFALTSLVNGIDVYSLGLHEHYQEWPDQTDGPADNR